MNSRTTSMPSLIIASFIFALILSVVPMPDWAQHLRPQWIALTLIYWNLIAPERIGISTGWFSGLLLDAMTGNLLGAHALSLSLIAYITLNIHQRTRVFPLWQQSLVIFALLLIDHAIIFWVIGMTQNLSPGIEFWFAPLIGLFLWPWLFIIMGEIQQRLRGNN